MRRGLRPASGRMGKPTLAGVALLATMALSAVPAWAQTPYNSLTLEWTAPGDDGVVGRATSYDLRYRTVGITGVDTVTWWNGATTVSGEPAPGTAGTTDAMTVTGLSQGTTYYFIIRAADEVPNWSGFSNVAVGTTQSCSAPAAAPGQFSAVADTGQVQLTWNSTNDPLAQSLNLYRAVGSGGFSLLQNLPGIPTSYTDTSVNPGTTYRYRAAWKGATCEGPYASAGPVTTPGIPGQPPPAAAGPAAIHVYPNPASGSIRLVIEVGASTAQAVRIRLFDMSGHWIATLAEGTFPHGTNEVSWSRAARDGQRVGPGPYELIGTVGSDRVHERLILLP